MTEDNEDISRFLDAVHELNEIFNEETTRYELEVDLWWESLSQDDRELAFYAVVKRLHKAELVENGTYRGILQDTFGFDDFYIRGLDCGFMELHNCIYSRDQMKELNKREAISRGAIFSEKKVKRNAKE